MYLCIYAHAFVNISREDVNISREHPFLGNRQRISTRAVGQALVETDGMRISYSLRIRFRAEGGSRCRTIATGSRLILVIHGPIVAKSFGCWGTRT